MSDMSTYLGGALFAWIKGTVMPAAPSPVTVALYSGDPEGAGSEVTGADGLTRQTVTFGSEAARTIENNAEIDFGTASGDVDVDYVALYHSNGSILSTKAISEVNILSGQKVTFASGDLGATY